MGIDFALKHFEIIILVGLKSIEVFFLFGVKATHTHTHIFDEDWIFNTNRSSPGSQQEMGSFERADLRFLF